MEPKFELVQDQSKTINGVAGHRMENVRNFEEVTVYRIRAIRDFGDIKTGDIGGWVEKDSNLSHTANCWIYDDATVINNAMVTGNTKSRGNTLMKDWAVLAGDAIMQGNAVLLDECVVTGNAIMEGDSVGMDVGVVAANAVLRGTAVASSKYFDVIAGDTVLDAEPEFVL